MTKVGVIFLPAMGIGHLISAVELAKRLVHGDQSRFSVTVLVMSHLVPAGAPVITSYIDSVTSLDLDIRFEELPHLDPPYKENIRGEVLIDLFIEMHKPLVKTAISRLLSSPSSIPIAAFVLDLFCNTMIDVGKEFGIPSYMYYTSGAATLGLLLYFPTLHVEYPREMEEIEGEINVPGLPPVPPLSMPSSMINKKDEVYAMFFRYSYRFREVKGIIVNTFAELEPNPLKAISEGRCLPDYLTPPVYPVGPLLALERDKAGSDHECIKWLDGQPTTSVVFLCFGSMGCFASPQVKEIALGLEKSGHRFLWSLRSLSPSNGSLASLIDANLEEVLPEGFLERTKGIGLVWPSWAPQVDILSHRAVGGFVTHCGWNSCLESLWFGVPMLVWPLYSEQHLNAFQIAKDLGVAVELRVDFKGGGFVRAEELERGLRCLMEDCKEGKKMRSRTELMKLASRKAHEEGGSSAIALECLMHEFAEGAASAIDENHHHELCH